MERLMLMLKFQNQPAVAEFLARQILASGKITGDVVIPIPLYKSRLKERGYNHAAELARFIASGLRLPLLLEGYGRVRDTASQAMLSGKDRRENVRNAFVSKLNLSGKSVIVVDDIMASGATLNEMARVLKRSGAATVTNLVVASAKRV
jgi:ComF family protein